MLGVCVDLMPVPWSAVASGGFALVDNDTASVYGAPALPTEPPVTNRLN